MAGQDFFAVKSASPPFYDDIDDDRGTDKWGDGIEGYHTAFAWQDTAEAASQSNDGTGKDGGWEQQTMVVGAEQETCDMRHSKADEGHRTAEGGDDGGEQSSDDEQPVAYTDDIDAEVFSIAVA